MSSKYRGFSPIQVAFNQVLLTISIYTISGLIVDGDSYRHYIVADLYIVIRVNSTTNRF